MIKQRLEKKKEEIVFCNELIIIYKLKIIEWIIKKLKKKKKEQEKQVRKILLK